MSRIIFHVGAPKSASSSIQDWLRANSGHLRDHCAIDVRLTPKRKDPWQDPPSIVSHRAGGVTSRRLVKWYEASGGFASALETDADGARRQFMDTIVSLLRALPETHDVVLTTEGFWRLLAYQALPFFEGLETLARDRPVEIVGYIRPQHEFMEASWRQWGFRTGRQPSDYVRSLERAADYEAIASWMATTAPSVTLTLRPTDPRLLRGGDVVEDFRTEGLGLPAGDHDAEPTRSNVGLPLEAVNALRAGPVGRFFNGPHDNRTLDRIKQLDIDWPPADERDLRLSRELLQAWCHDRFETGNRRLIHSSRWQLDEFVPAFDSPSTGAPHLELLDELWKPPPDTDLHRLWDSIDRALADDSRQQSGASHG